MAGFSAEDLNDRLMEDSGGVDFAALKAKYQRVKQESVSNSKHGIMESLHSQGHGQEGGGTGGVDAMSGTGANLASVTTTGLLTSSSSNNSNSSSSSTGTNEAIEAFRKLDKYKICNACNGAGVVKYKYNHMVLEKTCEVCDGDIVLDTAGESDDAAAATFEGSKAVSEQDSTKSSGEQDQDQLI